MKTALSVHALTLTTDQPNASTTAETDAATETTTEVATSAEEVSWDEGAWDDDSYSPPPILVNESSEAEAAIAVATPNERGDDEWQWHTSLSTSQSKRADPAAEDRESSRQAILSLGTPAAMKKERCIECTKPLPEEHQGTGRPALCPRCVGQTMGKERGVRFK
mmetsp:Transcript_19407/g.35123  ORF Transcript_19407/g.35123 Transcript_19407/m.35123 type:complete len:164 (-) Transcript_19407:62-553(-)